MNKLDRIIGFVILDNIEYPFEFNEKSFSLNLYPPTKRIWEESNNPFDFFNSNMLNTKRYEWIPERNIEGITSEGHNIVFCVLDSPSNHNGFITFRTNWCIYYPDELCIDEIEGFNVSGNDVNLFILQE